MCFTIISLRHMIPPVVQLLSLISFIIGHGQNFCGLPPPFLVHILIWLKRLDGPLVFLVKGVWGRLELDMGIVRLREAEYFAGKLKRVTPNLQACGCDATIHP
ncbi:hypothetical protein TRVL_07422 [Trypanosoma vivax]|nr:hypothetical protein TRVL_07422 [Trypanosoma vivax]